MDNVFYLKPRREVEFNSKNEYLNKCKETLEPEDYESVLCSIIDHKYYESLDEDLQEIVDNYHNLTNYE